MSNENMILWEKVYKTDPTATKKADLNGQKVTSISGQHMIKRATEMFGPVGIGWGWTVIEERFDQGGPYIDQNGAVIAHEVGHTTKVRLWFIQDGKRGEVEQYGCTRYLYRTNGGKFVTDTEAPKKSLTDAVKKALAMLGFSADIFLGLFDDLEYVAERQNEALLEKAEDKEAEIERQKQERLDWLKSALETMAGAVTMHELTKLHGVYVRSATRRNEEAFVKRLARAFEERKAVIEQQEATA